MMSPAELTVPPIVAWLPALNSTRPALPVTSSVPKNPRLVQLLEPYERQLAYVADLDNLIGYAPVAAKLSTAEIWAAIQANDLKLPNTISIDSRGRVFLTPHQVSYTLSPKLTRLNFENVVSGLAGRSFPLRP
jgi:hypothetical protein